MSKSEYKPINFNLSIGQVRRLKRAKDKQLEVTLSIKKNQYNVGEHTLHLTDSQIAKLNNMKSGVRISLSKTQMKAQTGGWLGAILPAVKAILPAVGKVLGTLGLSAASGAVEGFANKAARGEGMRGGCVEGINIVIPKTDVEIIVKHIKQFEDRNIIPQGSTEFALSNMKEQHGGFIAPLLGILGSIIAPIIAKAVTGNGLKRAGNGLVRAGNNGQGLKKVPRKKRPEKKT
jgi:hypothetical protein